MEDRKRILHRLSYFNQVRERRVRIDNLWQPFPKAQKKENTEEPQKKESPKRKSLLSRLLLFFAKPKAQKKENTPVDFPRQKLKKFATKLKAEELTGSRLTELAAQRSIRLRLQAPAE